MSAIGGVLCSLLVGLAPAEARPGETGQIAFSRGGDVWSAAPDGTGEVQLTSGPESDLWPRWSPEGNRIAVVRDGDLVLLRATGALLRVLTTHGDVAAAPSWSPDGRRLVYARGSGGIAVVEATLAGSDGTLLALGSVTSVAWNPIAPDQIAYTDGAAVFTVRPDGSQAGTVIVPPDPDGRTRDELAWDPQAGQVVFASTGVDGTRIEGAGLSLDGWTGDDRSPAWSADGQRMLFTRDGTLHVHQRAPFPGGGNVRSLGVAGATPDRQPTLIESGAVYETNAATQLFFRIRPVGTTPTVVGYQTVPGAGSATENVDYWGTSGQVSTPDPFGIPATMSVQILGDVDPEQDETFFVDFTFPSDPAAPLRVRGTILNDEGGRNGIITYTGDPQAVSALDPASGVSEVIVGSARSAVFSPSGDRLAYLRSSPGPIELVVADPGGVPEVVFPLAGPVDDEIAWSPDGSRLAWTVGSTLWVADPTNPSSASAVAGGAVTPSWSADTTGPRRLAFARPSTGLVCTIQEDGSGESCPTAGYQPRWSPDNTTIALLRGNVAVFLMNPDGTNERLVASATGTVQGGPRQRWSPRGGRFAFMTGNALVIAQEGSASISAAGLPPSLWAFDWSPDGNQLVVQGGAPSHFRLWVVGPDEAGLPFASARQVGNVETSLGFLEPRWSSATLRPAANLASRGGIERFGQARVEVSLSAPSPDTIVLTWETVDTGSATAGVDYTPVSGDTVVLQPGETSAALGVSLLDDALPEGPESFDLGLTDAVGARLGSAATASVIINDDDNPPVAVNDAVATGVDTPVDVDVIANDRDPDGDALTLTAVGSPAHGTATFAGAIVSYTPQAGFSGVDHFIYTISDGNGHTAQAAVSVFVGDEPVPPPPVLTVTPPFLDFGEVPVNKTKDLLITVTNNTAAPLALAGHYPVTQADPRPFDASDLEGCPRVPILDPGQSCTRRVRFWSVPGADAASPATLRIPDRNTFSTLALVPLFAAVGPPDVGPNAPPIPVDDLAGLGVAATAVLDALRNDRDPDDDLLRIVAVSGPLHGTAAVVTCDAVFPLNPNSDCIQYAPEAGFVGTDAIVYTVSDGRGGTASATYHLFVGNVVPVVNAISPSSGPTAGGQAVRITGANLGPNLLYRPIVAFACGGSIALLNLTSITQTEILATTPPGLPGLCDLRVTTVFGQTGQLANAYRYGNPPVARVRWINPAGGDWNLGSNWETGVVPTPAQDALIDIPISSPVTYAAGDLQINSLVSTQPMVFSAGTLTITGSLQANSVTFIGGAIVTGGDQTHGGPVTIAATTTLRAGGTLAFGDVVTTSGSDVTLRAAEIDFNGGAASVSGTGQLQLRPEADSTPIVVGGDVDGGTGSLDITDADIQALANGFSLVTIGSPTGTHPIVVDASGAVFADAVALQATAIGGSIAVDGTLRTTGAAARGVTLRGSGSGIRLAADIVTAGGPIGVSDDVVLAADTVRLDTTNGGATPAGADVTLASRVDADAAVDQRSLWIDGGGAGDVTVVGAIGSVQPVQGLTIARADDVSLQGVTTRDGGLMVAATGGDPSVVLRGAVDTAAGVIPGNITFTGPVTLEVGGAVTMTAPATLTSQDALTNKGQLHLGPGARAFLGGPFLSTATGTLLVDVAGRAAGQFGRLDTPGAVTLDGMLAIGLAGGFVPVGGDRFTVMTFGSRSGSFAATSLPPSLALDESDPTRVVVVDPDPAPSATTITTSGSPSRQGQPVTFTATVTAATGPGQTPRGSVQFDDTSTGATLGTVTLDAGGVATLEASALDVGSHAILATYRPEPGSPYAGSTGSLTQVVDPRSADLMVGATPAPNPVAAGSVLTYTVTATNAGPDTARGVRVALPVDATLGFVASSPAGACTGPLAGTAGTIACDLGDLAAGTGATVTIETRPTAAGPLSRTLTVSGNDADPDLGNNSVTISVTVRLDPVVLNVAENIVVADTAAVTPSVMLNVPENITVTDGPVVTPSVMLNVPENIVVTDTPTPTPSVMLNVPETIVVSDLPTVGIDPPPTVTIDQATGQADPTFRSPIEFTVTFSEPVTGFDASDVSFIGSTVGGTLVAQVERGPGSSLTVSVSGMSGSGTVVVSIAAGAAVDGNGNPSLVSTSTDNSVLFEPVATSTTLTSSRNPSLTTAPPVFTATVTPAQPGTAPTGVVQFWGNGLALGTSRVFERNGAFVALVTATWLDPAGGWIQARYRGDAAHAASLSAPLTQVIQDGTYYAEDVAGAPSGFVPVALNDAGRIAGTRHNGLVSRAGVFDPVSGYLTLDNSSAFSEALDMNDAGTVVGRRGPGFAASSGFVFRNGVLEPIPGSTSAEGVNALEQVAVNLQNGEAAIYEGATTTPLDLFEAHSLNDAGVVVGSAVGGDGVRRAVAWEGGALRMLGYPSSSANRVSNTGALIEPTDGAQDSAFLYRPEIGAADSLGLVRAWDLNDAAVVVTATPQEALVWIAYRVTTLASGRVDGMAVNGRGEIVAAVSGQLKRWTPVPTSALVASPATAFEEDAVTLTATLTSQGAPVAGQQIVFSLNGVVAGSATTGPDGVATFTGVFLGLPVGVHPQGVGASFAGSRTLGASTATAQLTVLHDLPPTVTINQDSVQQDPTRLSPIRFTVEFSEPVTGLDASDFSFAGSTVGGTLTANVVACRETCLVAVTGMSGAGTVVLSMPAGAVSDATGKPSQASVSVDNTVRYDGVQPTVTINQAAGQPDPNLGPNPIRFTVEFSEPVTGFDASDVSFAGSRVWPYTYPMAFVTGSGATYTVTVFVDDSLPSYLAVVSIPAGAAEDALGNPSEASTSTDNAVLNVTAGPRVFIFQAEGQADPTRTSPINFGVEFYRPVTGFDASDVSFAGSTVGGTLAATVTGSGASYTVTVTGMSGVGTVVASIPAGAAVDATGVLWSQASETFPNTIFDDTVLFDSVPPTVTINQALGQADPTSVSPIRFTVTFSEPVTGFDGSDLSFAGSTAGGTLTASVTGAGASYVVSVTGMSGVGTVVASIRPGAAVDAAGNPSAASTSTDNTVLYGISTAYGFVLPKNGGWAAFSAVSYGGAPSGMLLYRRGAVSFTASRVTTFVASGQTARLEGVGIDGRRFVAKVVDGGTGQPDVFQLWINGVEQTAGGSLLAGSSVVVQP